MHCDDNWKNLLIKYKIFIKSMKNKNRNLLKTAIYGAVCRRLQSNSSDLSELDFKRVEITTILFEYYTRAGYNIFI